MQSQRFSEMKKLFGIMMLLAVAMAGCDKPSRVDQYRAEKHQQDSIRLEEQVRSLAFYESQLETLMPVADSLLPLFNYERNEKYQDHGYYVAKGGGGLRVMVRDDGKDLLLYREGKRLTYPNPALKGRELEMVERAEHLQVTMADIKELEKRIQRTSLEVQKYQKRLQKQ